MEDTQVVNWDVEEEEEVEERPSESLGCSLEPLGQLHIFSSSYGPEKDSPERRVVKEPRTFSLATVVPESDEEGPSPAPDGPGPPFAFHLNSDTDDKESQQPGSGEASSAAGRGPAAETEPLKPVTTEIQLEKDQCSPRERNQDTEVKPGARNGVVPVGVIVEMSQPAEEDSDTDVGNESWPPGQPAVVHSERAQPSGFIDSDTDEEEEGIPATPAVVPVKKRQIFHEVGTEHPRAPDEARLQDSPAGSDTDIEEREARLTGPLERSQGSMMIDSDTDDEEEVSAALTLARLRESQAVMWNRGSGTEADRAQPVVLLKPIQASAGRDSDTDVEEEGLPLEKIGTVPKGHTDKTHSEKSQPSLRGSDIEAEEDKSSPGVHLERSQASASVGVNPQVEEEVPPGSAVILLDKHQVPVAWTRQTDVEAEGGPAKLPVVHLEEAQPLPAGGCEPDVEEDTSLAASVVADVSKSQLPAERDAGTEWAAAVLEQDRALTAGAQDGSQVEPGLHSVSRENLADLVVDTGTPGEPTQSQREGAQPPSEREREPHVDGTMNSGDNHDDSEDLDLQATQCFVERENPSLKAVPSMEDEPTQAFLFTLPQEPGPSRCSFQAAAACLYLCLGQLNCKMPPAEKASRVLFTGVVDARGQRAVLALGGSLASSVAEASHLVTDRIRRTVKFLCALGRGIPILSLDWLHQSRKAGCFLPPDEYVVTDPEQEKNFGFSLREALSRARERRLLEGYEIHVTPGVQPPPLQMGEIISCCGGTFLPSMPRSYKPQRVVITCSKDFPRCSIPFRVGLPILSPEFLLTGVLKQEAKPEAFVLSTLKMSSI
ncbi:Mediator of DNA damage checkpoint protein 1 [Camelus dromedarius]|uniref:Mediator of DNA damage checkpoint protein 1 n=1 Tax=Camelus dromedarius TaxID=9838 RepID=A0A5N4CSN1_CAMDR|nr:Mediator of DNA damage checkpoint protein 1 [Camelus dromedarius]